MVPRASALFFMFCAPGLIFDGTEGAGSRFHVLRSQARFWWCGGRRVLPDSFSTVSRVSHPVFIFCALRLIFVGSGGVGSRFHVLRARSPFGVTEGIGSRFHILLSRTSFFVVPRASAPLLIPYTPGLVFGGIEGGASYFHVLRARTRFRR
jgi:hypothetical protein